MVNVQKFSIIPAAGEHYTNIFNPNTDNEEYGFVLDGATSQLHKLPLVIDARNAT